VGWLRDALQKPSVGDWHPLGTAAAASTLCTGIGKPREREGLGPVINRRVKKKSLPVSTAPAGQLDLTVLSD